MKQTTCAICGQPVAALVVEAEAARYRSPQLASAFRRGASVGRLGAPRTDNPYADVRTRAGHVTFSRAYRRAWANGWDAGAAARSGAVPA